MRHYSKSAYRSIDSAREPHGQDILALCHSDYVESESPVNYTDQIIQTTENSQVVFQKKYGILLSKLFWTAERKNCSSDREKKAESQEFAKFLRSLEQFIQTVKGQNNSW